MCVPARRGPLLRAAHGSPRGVGAWYPATAAIFELRLGRWHREAASPVSGAYLDPVAGLDLAES